MDDSRRTKRVSSYAHHPAGFAAGAQLSVLKGPSQCAGPIVSATRWFEATAVCAEDLLGIRKVCADCRTAPCLYHAENLRAGRAEKLEGRVYGMPVRLGAPPGLGRRSGLYRHRTLQAAQRKDRAAVSEARQAVELAPQERLIAFGARHRDLDEVVVFA
jgi:hypothetical protein